jgi:hypothetical protein
LKITFGIVLLHLKSISVIGERFKVTGKELSTIRKSCNVFEKGSNVNANGFGAFGKCSDVFENILIHLENGFNSIGRDLIIEDFACLGK